MTINGDKQAALQTLTGSTGHVSGLEHEWLNSEGAASGTLNEKWLTFLTAQGFTSGTLNERLLGFLDAQGYSGTIEERLVQYWEAGGGT